MKNLLFGIIAIFLFPFSGMTQETKFEKGKSNEFAYLTVTINKEVVKYYFDSIKDFKENSEKIIDDIAINPEKNNDENCNIIIEICLSINKSGTTSTIVGTITTENSKIAYEAKKINDRLIEVFN